MNIADPRRPPGPVTRTKLTNDQRHEIAARYLQGDTVKQLAEEYGVSVGFARLTAKTYSPHNTNVDAFTWIGRAASA
ncbi:hypothetical protein AB0F30_33375 [Streptomyces sp. NPDC029006]|uniref:hypothetical protein n=1 Tax=Streptomyces sp. NPDC029006 TaxID=3155467 RepID=UPI00340BC6FC